MRLMLCGLVGSLPMLTVMLALSAAPPAVGMNFTAMVQCEFGNAVVPQVPPVTVKSAAFASLKFPLKGSEKGDKLATVRFRVFDVVFSLPYASVAGVTVAGIVGPLLSATA